MPSQQRFYIYSIEGDGAALAWRLKAEGYEVVWHCEDMWRRQNLSGIIEHTSALPRMSDVVVFDGVGSGAKADRWRASGLAVVGASEVCDKLELDRNEALRVCHELDISTPRAESFSSIAEGIKFVSANGGRWVFKPSENVDCAFTYCARDEIDMVGMLLHMQSMLGDGVEYMMQEYIDGVCVSTEGWFDGEEWVEGAWNSTIEVKKLCVGDVGPATGCSWCVVWSSEDAPRIAREMHLKLTPMLRDAGYVGPWDCNCMIDTTGVARWLEHTPRVGYDAIEAYAALLNQSLGASLVMLAEGDTSLWRASTDEVGVALRVAVPPYPYGSEEHPAKGGLPVRYRQEDESHLWLVGVEMQRKALFTTACDGWVGVIGAMSTIADYYGAAKQVKQIARRMAVPDLLWRDDPCSGIADAWQRLAALGYDSPIATSIAPIDSMISIGQLSI